MGKLTQKGALLVTRDINKLAALLEADHATLGISQKVAANMVERLDRVADHIERVAGLDPQDEEKKDAILASFDPSNIGEEQSGPIETVEADEPFMQGEFTQQENRELADRQEAGALGTTPILTPRAPTPGKQAELKTAAEAFLRLANAENVKVGAYLKQHMAAEKAAAEAKAKTAAELKSKQAAQGSGHGYRLDA